jgi:imidazolonepropionase-like amidohydrolase
MGHDSTFKSAWMKAMKTAFTFALILVSMQGFAQSTLIKNVNIFDGKNEELAMGQDVLIEKNLVSKIGVGLQAPADTTVIDGGGRTLMPGMIDAHTHLWAVHHEMELRNNYDSYFIGASQAFLGQQTLMRGFTTVRDTGGPAIGLKKSIDEGWQWGPRIYASGPMISQTSGHGDMRNITDPHPNIGTGSTHYFDSSNPNAFVILADGRAEVLRAVREVLKQGNSQVKVMAGGGVSTPFDPLLGIQYTLDEMKAAVEAADDYGTYVLVHAHTDEAMQRAIEAGVKVIDHGVLGTEKTFKLMAKKGVWLSPTARNAFLLPEDYGLTPDMPAYAKMQFVNANAKHQLEWAKKYGVKMVFSSDRVFTKAALATQNEEFLTLKELFTPFEILKMATSLPAELNKLTTYNNPFTEGELGVIEEGAYADLLIVDGNPMTNIDLLVYPERSLKLIMKDGVIYKNKIGDPVTAESLLGKYYVDYGTVSTKGE